MTDAAAELKRKKIEASWEFQDFVADQLFRHCGIALVNFQSKVYQVSHGENLAGFEIKNDKKYCETGRLFIEFEKKDKPEDKSYYKSGIYRDSWIYVVGDLSTLFLFPTKLLRHVHRHGRRNGRRYLEKEARLDPDLPATARGFLLPDREARVMAARIVEIPSSR